METVKMTEQEVNDYMTSLLQSSALASKLETECLEEWKRLTSEISKASEALNRAKSETERLSMAVQQMHGGRQTLLRLLVTEEEGRRRVKDIAEA